jgi:hypothetical protein
MKYLSLSLLLPVLSLAIAFSQPAIMPAPLDAAVSNAFLDLLVNDAGAPALRTTGGTPTTPADDDEPLLFGANTSFTSVWIDGTATSLRDTTPTAGPTAEGDAITTTWTVGEIEITQTHALATNPYTGRPDTMQVTTTLRNAGASEHEAGVRVLLDVLVGGSDVATLLVPGAGVVTTEQDYQATLPLFYRIFGEAESQPDAVQALGLLVAPGTTPPDRFVVGRWSELDATVWDYTVTPDAALDDSAVAMWWAPASLAPGATRSVTTFYGLADWTAADAWFDAPAGVTCDEREFTATLWVRNRGETARTGGEATLTLPAGLALAEGETAAKMLEDVPPQDARSIVWRLVATQTGDWTYSAQVTFTEGESLTAGGTMSVPACDGTPTPTNTPTATMTVTVTLAPITSPTLTPTGTPTTTEEWDVYLPLIRRDD